MKIFITMLTAFILSISLVACDNDGGAENFGEKVDDAYENTKDAVDDAADNVSDGIEDACEKATDDNC